VVDFEEAGYRNLLIMTDAGDRGTPQSGRSRAA
jgi:hypothetical protein